MISVTGFTTADIHAARDAEGAGGVLNLPKGFYDCDGLVADKANQTWILEPGAVLLRNPTSLKGLLELKAPLRIRGGTLDCNRANNTNPGGAITAFVNGCNLDIQGTTIKNINSWGIGIDNAELTMRDCVMQDGSLAFVIWRANSGAGQIAPKIFNCVFDRSNEVAATIDSACVLIQAPGPTQLMLNPQLQGCRFVMPYTSNLNCVLVELLHCQRGSVRDCTFTGGRIGLSIANCSGMVISGNKFQVQHSYALELGTENSIVTENFGTGYGPSMDGITVNPACSGTLKVYGNTFNGYTRASIFDPSSKITHQWAN